MRDFIRSVRRSLAARSLVLLVVLCVLAGSRNGWTAERVDPQQAKLIAAIEALGGVVDRGSDPGSPSITVVLNGPKFTDAEVAPLKDLAQLDDLRLGGTEVTGTGLKGLTQVKALSFMMNAKITDAGLANIEGLTQLQVLDLTEPQFTDAALVHVKGLTSLRSLSLLGTKTQGSGLKHLKGLTKLRTLSLWATAVTDAGLADLEALKSLEALYLTSTKISDAGLAHIKGLTQLRVLSLDRTAVSDAGMVQLEGLTRMERLDLKGSQVTEKGAAAIQKALPHCEVNR